MSSNFLQQLEIIQNDYDECSRFFAENENGEIILDLQKSKLYILKLKNDFIKLGNIFNIRVYNSELSNNSENEKKVFTLLTKIQNLLQKITESQNKLLPTYGK